MCQENKNKKLLTSYPFCISDMNECELLCLNCCTMYHLMQIYFIYFISYYFCFYCDFLWPSPPLPPPPSTCTQIILVYYSSTVK